MDRFQPRQGTPAPYHRHMNYIADSYDRAFRDAFADYIATSPDFFIAGAHITATPSGTSVNYSVTEGSACYKGEFLRVDAHSIVKLSTQVVFFQLYEDAVDLFPVLNADGNSENVMRRRRIRLRVGPAYPSEFMSINAPRKEDIDTRRFKGRIFVPGMIVPYNGSLSVFDGTGKGIEGMAMEGWALCNGLNGTIDMRGLVPVGATNIPDVGAETVREEVGGSAPAGEVVGRDLKQIAADDLPPHTHQYRDTFTGGSGDRTMFQPGMALLTEHRDTDPNPTAHNPFDVRQAGRALAFVQCLGS